ncbi:MAG: sulfurtransferase TusA family protein [Armatimonadota bacterium]
MAVYNIDARELQCPGPIIRLSSKVKEIYHGDIITIEVGDLGFKQDINAWCKKTRNELISLNE